jgi:hypothetical protein
MGTLASANREIRDAERQSVEQRLARLTAPHRLTDRVLDQMEELNLEDVTVVPDRYEPILADLRQQLMGYRGLNERLVDRLQAGRRTSDLIETIFSIQEVIAPPTLPAGEFAFDNVDLM